MIFPPYKTTLFADSQNGIGLVYAMGKKIQVRAFEGI
jgi:hypothetical protein